MTVPWYRPQSVELYTQKDKEFLEYAGDKYAPLSKTNLRFSDLTAHPKLIITYDDVIKLHLVVTTWRAVDSSIEKINEIVSCIGANPLNVNYPQYI